MGVPEREGVLEYISERSPRNLIVIFPEGVFLEINGIAIHSTELWIRGLTSRRELLFPDLVCLGALFSGKNY
jgi:hypothetical protein